MENNFQAILQGYLSPDYSIRSTAENQLNSLIEKGNPNDLDMIYSAIASFQNNNQLQLFLALLITKVINTINNNNRSLYQEYFKARLDQILLTTLNIQCDLKTLRQLCISLNLLLKLLDITYLQQSVNKIFEFYLSTKASGQSLAVPFRGFFCFVKLLKYYFTDGEISFDLSPQIASTQQDFIFISEMILDPKDISNLEIKLEFLKLYLKFFIIIVGNLRPEMQGPILKETMKAVKNIILNLQFLIENSHENCSGLVFDVIFLSNQLVLVYLRRCNVLSKSNIVEYIGYFDNYIEQQNFTDTMLTLLTSSKKKRQEKDPEFKKDKFLNDIINFYKELLQITHHDYWDELILLKDDFWDDQIAICNYLSQEYFTTDKVCKILNFAIVYGLSFTVSEINMGKNEWEEFYIWFDNMPNSFDLRLRSGTLCKIIYDKYKKEIRSVFNKLEDDLVRLNFTEVECLSKGTSLSFEDINYRCAILSLFGYLSTYYFNKKRDYNKWIDKIILPLLDSKYLNVNGSEIFSKFLVIKLLSYIIDIKELQTSKNLIFEKIYELFNAISLSTYQIMLSYIIVDFFNSFIDDIMPVEFPNNFLQNYIVKLCEILKSTDSPEVHGRLILTTSKILNKFKDEEIKKAFPIILPILAVLWNNNWEEYEKNTKNLDKQFIVDQKQINQKNSIQMGIVRKNFLILIGVFVKRVGVFFSANNDEYDGEFYSSQYDNPNVENTIKSIDEGFFNFIYGIIGFSIQSRSPEATLLLSEGFKLIFILQDEYALSSTLSVVNNFEKFKVPLEQGIDFPYYLKIYDYLNIILENLNYSSEYFFVQMFLIEQYISISFVDCISQILENINFVEKLVYIFNKHFNMFFNDFHQVLFNLIEYFVFAINKISKIPQIKKESFNKFAYEIFQKVFTLISDAQILKITQEALNSKEEEKPLYEINELVIYIGGIQLGNRLLYTYSTLYNTFNQELLVTLSQKINLLLPYICRENKLNVSIIQEEIIDNAITNINNLSAKYNCMIHLEKPSKHQGGAFLQKDELILGHWLFFFNKIINSKYYYNLTASEDKLRLLWGNKFEKFHLLDNLSSIDFQLKYISLKNDDMNG